ncbi:MAG: hypothetical protein RLY86_3536 [Pseudomonadota bacterium]|jgi:hypothetical protein
MRLRPMHLRPPALIAALILLFLLAYTAWWASAAWALRQGVEAWAADQRAQGAVVSWADLAIAGFPLELAAELRDLDWQAPGGGTAGPVVATAARVSAAADAWNPWTVRITAVEKPSLTVPAIGRIYTAATATGEVRLDAGGLRAGQVAFQTVRAGPPGNAEELTAQTVQFLLTRPAAPPAAHTDPLGTAGVAISGLTLQRAPDPPLGDVLGPTIAQLALTGTVKGALPTLTPPDLRAWSEAGGTLELTGLALDWGQVSLRGEGTMALDSALQPQLAGTIQAGGIQPLLDALAAMGLIRPQLADQLRPVVTLLSQPREDGVRRAALPITIQDSRLNLGPAPITRLPRIDWGG